MVSKWYRKKRWYRYDVEMILGICDIWVENIRKQLRLTIKKI